MTTPTNREAVDWQKKLRKWGFLLPKEAADRIGENISQEIRQTHLDLLREVEREVIGEDWIGEYHTVRRVNKELEKQRTKLSHIITRVEGK